MNKFVVRALVGDKALFLAGTGWVGGSKNATRFDSIALALGYLHERRHHIDRVKGKIFVVPEPVE